MGLEHFVVSESKKVLNGKKNLLFKKMEHIRETKEPTWKSSSDQNWDSLNNKINSIELDYDANIN